MYGDDPDAKLLEAGLASTALPVVWDPEMINGHQFVDGGVIANVPISIAMDRGATDNLCARLARRRDRFRIKKGVINIALHTIGVQTLSAGAARYSTRVGSGRRSRCITFRSAIFSAPWICKIFRTRQK